MATNKKSNKKNKKRKQTKSKKVVAKNVTPKKKVMKKALMKKAAPKKATVKKKVVRGKSQSVGTVAFEPEGRRARSGGQAGDLQGLAGKAGADSESVDELLEEGNAFEAEVVEGVQDAPDADKSEVVTHEVPEDDVPEEYLDNEQ
jgi:hypothetical protein